MKGSQVVRIVLIKVVMLPMVLPSVKGTIALLPMLTHKEPSDNPN